MARTAAPKDADPAPQGRIAQFRAVFTMTRKADRALVWYMLLVFVACTAVGVGIGWLVFDTTYFKVVCTLFGVMTGVLVAVIIFGRRAEQAVYRQIAGQPGTVGYALRGLRRGWNVEEQPVAVDPRTQDLVFRAVGRPGIVLVTEGPLPRVQRLADLERKRMNKLFAQVPVLIVHGGDGEGQIPLRKLSRTIMRKRPALSKAQVSELSKRIRPLGQARLPIPKGVDPSRMRPDRRATKGR